MTKVFMIVFGLLDNGQMFGSRTFYPSIEDCDHARHQAEFVYAPAHPVQFVSFCIESQ